MPVIHLTTFIAAPAAVVFDLARHIGLHKESMSSYKEEAVAGTRFGLIENGETVTWKSKHFFRYRIMRMKVTEMVKPERYTVEQIQGEFRSMRHEYFFKPCENGMLLIELFQYETRYGLLGKMINRIFLNKYFKRLLEQRVRKIKEYGESGRWKPLLNR